MAVCSWCAGIVQNVQSALQGSAANTLRLMCEHCADCAGVQGVATVQASTLLHVQGSAGGGAGEGAADVPVLCRSALLHVQCAGGAADVPALSPGASHPGPLSASTLALGGADSQLFTAMLL